MQTGCWWVGVVEEGSCLELQVRTLLGHLKATEQEHGKHVSAGPGTVVVSHWALWLAASEQA